MTAASSTEAVAGLTERLRAEIEASAATLHATAKDSTESSTHAVAALTDRLRLEMETSATALQSVAETSTAALQSVAEASSAALQWVASVGGRSRNGRRRHQFDARRSPA